MKIDEKNIFWTTEKLIFDIAENKYKNKKKQKKKSTK